MMIYDLPRLSLLAFIIAMVLGQLVIAGEAGPITALGDVNLRTAPPSGLFCKKGRKLTVVKAGEAISHWKKVETTCALIFTYQYYEVSLKRDGKSYSGFVAKYDSNGESLFAE